MKTNILSTKIFIIALVAMIGCTHLVNIGSETNENGRGLKSDQATIAYEYEGEAGIYKGDVSRRDGLQLPNGQGRMMYDDGKVLQGVWAYGVMNGEGVLSYGDGTRYNGMLRGTMRHGQGKMINCGEIEYDGRWFWDERDESNEKVYNERDGLAWSYDTPGRLWGKDTWSFANNRLNKNGELFSGPHKETMEWMAANGELNAGKYDGEWRNGNATKGRMEYMFGHGLRTYEKGGVYDGEFYFLTQLVKNGKGKYTAPNGEIWDGEWLSDRPCGWGTYKRNASEPGQTGQWNRSEGFVPGGVKPGIEWGKVPGFLGDTAHDCLQPKEVGRAFADAR